ncbi:MAG: DUF4286 family protein [Candidatus Saccharimonadaceae bacterium]
MITLNTTFHVDDAIHLDFLVYMRESYIADALADKETCSVRLCKVHSHNVEEGHSYSLQFTFTNIDDLETWDQNKGKKLNEKLILQFDNKIAGFSTLLEEIEI